MTDSYDSYEVNSCMASSLLIISFSLCLLQQGAAASFVPTGPSTKSVVPCQVFHQPIANGGFLIYPLPGVFPSYEICELTTGNSTSGIISVDITQSNIYACGPRLQILHKNATLLNIACGYESNFFTLEKTTSVSNLVYSGKELKPHASSPETRFFMFYSYSAMSYSCRNDNTRGTNGGVIKSTSNFCGWYISNSRFEATQLIITSRNVSSTSQGCNTFKVYMVSPTGWLMRTYTVALNISIPYSTFVLTCEYDPSGGRVLDVTYQFISAPAVRDPRTTASWAGWPSWNPWTPTLAPWTPTRAPWTSVQPFDKSTDSMLYIVVPFVIMLCLLFLVCRLVLRRKGRVQWQLQRQEQQIRERNNMIIAQLQAPPLNYSLYPTTIRPAAHSSNPANTSFSNPAYSLTQPGTSSEDPIDAPPAYDDVINEGHLPTNANPLV